MKNKKKEKLYLLEWQNIVPKHEHFMEKKEDRDIPKLLTVVFSRGGCIDDLNLIFLVTYIFQIL